MTDHTVDESHNSTHFTDKQYVVVALVLAVITALEVTLSYVDIGRWFLPLLLVLMVIKFFAVVMYFMHVRYSTRLIPLVAAGGFFWLLILFGITMSDYLSRGWLGAGSAWPAPWSH